MRANERPGSRRHPPRIDRLVSRQHLLEHMVQQGGFNQSRRQHEQQATQSLERLSMAKVKERTHERHPQQ